MKAKLLKVDGQEPIEIESEGRVWKTEELAFHIGVDFMQQVDIGENRIMFVDEWGIANRKRYNSLATLYSQPVLGGRMILGDAVIVNADDEKKIQG